jgi:hemolysin activation/secretion protein
MLPPHALTRMALPSTLSLMLASLMAAPLAQAAEGALRGNPLDTLPQIEAPPPPAPPPLEQPAAPSQEAVQGVLAQRVVPRYFDVVGVRSLPFEEVVAILEPLAGKETTVGALAQRVDAISTLYRDRGYVLSFALLQNQDFSQGVVQVTVVEGFVGTTRITGEPGPVEARLRALAARIESERPLTRPTLERYLNLIALVPGLTVRPSLDLPNRADGATELVLDVSRNPLGLEGGLADMGLGLQGLVSASTRSLTALGETLQVSATLPIGSADVEYYRAAGSVPIGNDGLSLTVDAYKYRSSPEDASLELLGLKRQVRAERAQALLSYPVWLANDQALTVSGGFYATRNIDRYTNPATDASVAITTDVRVLQAGVTYLQSTARQSRNVSVNLFRGLNRLGARQNDTSDYNLAFTRVAASFNQSVSLTPAFGLSFSGAGQYSNHELPSSEQISFGGWRYGLGYPAGELAGDSGWGLALEGNYTYNWDSPWLRSIQPYVRADYARTYHRNETLAQVYGDSRLSSVALGVRLSDKRYYTLDLNVARPVGDLPVNSNSRSLRFNVNYSLRYN